MKILVGSTAAGHKAAHAQPWLGPAEAVRAAATPHQVDFFLAAEMQADGREPRLEAAEARVRQLGGTVWRFMLDDGAERIDGSNRLARICTGRNLVCEYALRSGAEWVLFLDSDVTPPADVLSRLLEMQHPFCGFVVQGYGLAGPTVARYPYPVQAHWASAGAWFVHRSLLRRFRWLWDPDDGLTDDPATHRLVLQLTGVEQHVRHDVVGHHPPLMPFERRPGDTALQRHPLSGHPLVAVVPAYYPTAAHVQMTQAVLQRLLREPTARVYLLDNGGDAVHAQAARAQQMALAQAHGGRLQRIAAEDFNIHQMWNMGWAAALQDFGDQVLIAFVNNDIHFRPGTLEVLARALLKNEVWATHPDNSARVADGVRLSGRSITTHGSKRHGGLTGHCFVIKGGIHTLGGLAMFDTRFHWWYGDDDFAFRIERAGYQVHAVEGLPCDHLNEATLVHRPEWAARRDADRALFVALWGER